MNRTRLLAFSALSVSLIALGAEAQTEPQKAGEVSEIVVTGARVARSRLDSLAPVDLIRADTLSRNASSELAQALSTAAPSVNFPRPSAVDGTDSIRPAALRGLSPDQTLVLVNGVRQHASALLNVNGSIGRGSQAVDLNTIPLAALDRVEVLRDGASAQYGSDALAGVVNLRLRQASSGGQITAGYSQYHTDIDAARSSRSADDGRTLTLSGWVGLPLGKEGGYLTLSGEVKDRKPTSRGDVDPRLATPAVNNRYGDPKSKDYTFFANAGLPLGDGFEGYGWLGAQKRESESAAFVRLANNANNVPSLYPNGFLPLIGVETEDLSAAAGVRGDLYGWKSDFNLSYGSNRVRYTTKNSLNSTYGAQSKTSFNSGGFNYDQLTARIEAQRPVHIGLANPATLSLGLEHRHETYEIIAGEPSSYDKGPAYVPGLALGAQGFPGLQPSNVVNKSRSNTALYADLDTKLTDKLNVDLALRGEDYSDFGSRIDGKIAARYSINDQLALRGSVSTGFRAPGLAQSYYTATTTAQINGQLYDTGTFPSTSPIGKTLGGKALEAEKARNYTLGGVFKSGNFELTLDAYRIEIENRIVLSENLGAESNVAPLLAPYGISRARFFVNGVDTTTDGVDLVARYRLNTTNLGRYDLTLAASHNETSIDKLPSNNTLSSLNPPPVLFGRVSQKILTDATPKNKVIASVDWLRGPFAATVRATYYDKAIEPGTTAAADISTGAKTLIDLEGRYKITPNVQWSLGVDNVFDEYPNKVPASLNSTGTLAFSRYSPFGFNGRQVFTRLSYSW